MLYLDYSRKEGEWLPNSDGGRENWEAVEFLRETTALAYRDFPGVMMIAEESTAWSGVTRRTDEGGLGFGFKWNMGWMHDTLHYLSRETVHRGHHHGEITFSVLTPGARITSSPFRTMKWSMAKDRWSTSSLVIVGRRWRPYERSMDTCGHIRGNS